MSSWPRSEAPSLEQSLLRAMADAHHPPLLVLQHRMSPCLKAVSREAASSVLAVPHCCSAGLGGKCRVNPRLALLPSVPPPLASKLRQCLLPRAAGKEQSFNMFISVPFLI